MRSKDIIRVENLNRGNKFIIRWQLTYLCNYSCDFCIQGNKNMHIAKSKNENMKTRTKICDNLVKFIEKDLNKKYSTIEIYLIGGEVIVLKDFLQIVKKIVNANFDGKISIVLTTNLSLSKEKLGELIDIFTVQKKHVREIHINASYYKEFTSEEEFISKIKLLSKNKSKKMVFINSVYKKMKRVVKKCLSSKTIDSLKSKISKIYVTVGYPICCDNDYKDYLEFKKKYSHIIPNINFIIIKGYKTSISDALKEKIVRKEKLEKNIKVTFNDSKVFYCTNNNQISLKLTNEETFNSQGYLCDIGMHNISIGNTGLISRCPSCKEKTTIGSMLEGDFKLPKEKMSCPIEYCNCSYYGVIEKQ